MLFAINPLLFLGCCGAVVRSETFYRGARGSTSSDPPHPPGRGIHGDLESTWVVLRCRLPDFTQAWHTWSRTVSKIQCHLLPRLYLKIYRRPILRATLFSGGSSPLSNALVYENQMGRLSTKSACRSSSRTPRNQRCNVEIPLLVCLPRSWASPID